MKVRAFRLTKNELGGAGILHDTCSMPHSSFVAIFHTTLDCNCFCKRYCSTYAKPAKCFFVPPNATGICNSLSCKRLENYFSDLFFWVPH